MLNEFKWIPISERLPKEGEKCLCTRNSIAFSDKKFIDIFIFSNDLYEFDKYDFHEYKNKKRKGFYNFSSEYGYYEVENIIAWMPLPEPYEEVIKDE